MFCGEGEGERVMLEGVLSRSGTRGANDERVDVAYNSKQEQLCM